MRAHVSQTRVGRQADGNWAEVGVIPVSDTGHHYTGRASTDGDFQPAGRLELRGEAGVTVLWAGALEREAMLIALPVTLPGERLVFMAQSDKSARFTFELAWVEPGEHTPRREELPCSR